MTQGARSAGDTLDVDALNVLRPSGRVRALRGASFEVALAVWSFAYGLLMVAEQHVPAVDVTGRVADLPPVYADAIGVLAVLGGVAVLASFLCRSRLLGSLLTLERVGLSLLGGAWFTYGAALVGTNVAAVHVWSGVACGVVAMCARWMTVRDDALTIRDATAGRVRDRAS